MKSAVLVLSLALLLLAGSAVPALAAELLFSVAISMKEAIEELGRQFVKGRPGLTLRYNFGASGELQKQIEAGAPVDLFVSAGERQLDELERRGLIHPETRKVFARNALIVIRPAVSPLDLAKPSDLLAPAVKRIVIGNPKTVPVGQYSEESLRNLGLWERIQSRLVFAENARQALEYVARGEVDAGLVYATDAATRPGRVKEAFRLPEETHRPVVYPVAVVRGTRHPEIARAFIELLLNPAGQAAVARLGFQPPLSARAR